jgi:hypothetical protein
MLRAGRATGALLTALALLAMAVFAPLHAVSHVGEGLGGPEYAGLETSAGDSQDPSERDGLPCDLCLACFNGAFASAPGDDGPTMAAPRAASDLRGAAPIGEIPVRTARHERPEPRGPPPARV